MITQETRRESNKMVDRLTRCRKIMEAYATYGPMTARECARKLGFTDLNAVKPRITELCQKGYLRACGKAYDGLTKRNVAVFAAVPSAAMTRETAPMQGTPESAQHDRLRPTAMEREESN